MPQKYSTKNTQQTLLYYFNLLFNISLFKFIIKWLPERTLEIYQVFSRDILQFVIFNLSKPVRDASKWTVVCSLKHDILCTCIKPYRC